MQQIYERYVNFYTDFAFKKLFGTEVNKDLLISFLNALLQGQERICELTYLNTEHLGVAEADRKAVFDVYCENERGEKILVEMQKAEQKYFKDRSIFYSTFPIREQAERGDWDYSLKAVYTIGILNFTFDDSDPEYFHHEVKLIDTKTQQVFYDKLTYIYLEMPKFRKREEELVTLFDKWLYAIRNLPTLMERPEALQEAVFAHLFEAAEIAKFAPQERRDYEYSLKVFRDMYSVMQTAEWKGLNKGLEEGLKKGLKKGRAEGLEKGRAEGLKEGLEKGRIAERLQIARAMKSAGASIEMIMSVTALSKEEIEQNS